MLTKSFSLLIIAFRFCGRCKVKYNDIIPHYNDKLDTYNKKINQSLPILTYHTIPVVRTSMFIARRLNLTHRPQANESDKKQSRPLRAFRNYFTQIVHNETPKDKTSRFHVAHFL